MTKEHANADQTESVVVTPTRTGWEVRQERAGQVIKRVTYQDWHRVERALQLFELAHRPAIATP
jgi:hypothetical protein